MVRDSVAQVGHLALPHRPGRPATYHSSVEADGADRRDPATAVHRGIRRLEGVAEITAHADVKAAAKNWERFSSDVQGDPDVRTYRQLPLEIDPPAHSLYRAILNPIFSRPKVALLETALRATALHLVGDFVRRGSAEAVRELAIPMVGASIAAAFGRPQDAGELASWGLTSWEIRPDGTRDGGRLETYLERVFADAVSSPGDDAFSLIAAADVEGRRLTRTEQFGLGNLILAGGRDTVIFLVCGALWHLAIAGDERRRLAGNPDAVPVAVEELLRYFSPLPRMERRVTEAVEGPWGHAESEDIVLLGFAEANHDGAAFDDPEALRLDRSPNPHVAFGNGPHTCIGVHLARLEARVFLESMLELAPDWHLGAGSRMRMVEIAGTELPGEFETLFLEVGR